MNTFTLFDTWKKKGFVSLLVFIVSLPFSFYVNKSVILEDFFGLFLVPIAFSAIALLYMLIIDFLARGKIVRTARLVLIWTVIVANVLFLSYTLIAGPHISETSLNTVDETWVIYGPEDQAAKEEFIYELTHWSVGEFIFTSIFVAIPLVSFFVLLIYFFGLLIYKSWSVAYRENK